MIFRRSNQFKKDLSCLPSEIFIIAKNKFQLFKERPYHPFHPSLRIKPMEGFPNIYEGHITKQYVFTFEYFE